MTREERVDHLKRGSSVPGFVAATAGSVSGLVARTFTAPLDVVKIRLQLQTSGNKYKGIIQTMKVISVEESIYALWKGNIPASAMYIIYGAVQFSSYNFFNTVFTDLQDKYGVELDRASHSFVLGSLAGCTSTFVSYPCDLLRTRFISSPRFSRIYTTVQDIVRQEGPNAFFKGLSPALVSISLYTGLMFWAYETAIVASNRIDIYPSIVEPTCGFIAGTFAKGIVFPLDLIRKRLQVNRGRNESFVAKGLEIFKMEGFRGLYKGFFVSLIKNAPTTAISIWTYQTLLRFYMVNEGLES